ncbi:hypothetical protein BX616_003542, partial [Lobosporangium transversale]
MKTNKKSLAQLLLDIFNSDDQDIKRSVQSFYKNKGSASIVKVWALQLKSKRSYNGYDYLSKAAADIVVEGAKSELEQLTWTNDLRLPANNLSPTVVQKFSLTLIEKKLVSPLLFKIIYNLTRVDDKHTKYAPAVAATILSMLVKLRSQKSNYLQMMMGLHLHASGCPKRVINLLAAFGISVSHMTICTALKSLTTNSLQEVRLQVRKRPFFLVYDNINIANRKYDQRSNNLDSFDNGTTSTIVLGEDIGPDQDVTVPPTINTFFPEQLYA